MPFPTFETIILTTFEPIIPTLTFTLTLMLTLLISSLCLNYTNDRKVQ